MKAKFLNVVVVMSLYGKNFSVERWFHLHAEQWYALPTTIKLEFS